MDPMLFEALLIGQRSDTERGTSTPSCTTSRDPSTGEIYFPMLLRSEAEQLVGQELIKPLSDFKKLEAAPLTPQTQQPNPPAKVSDVEHQVDSDVEHPMDTQSIGHLQKTKLKCRKPVVKVARDMLTKK
jgi:hypothetical protein